MKRNLFDDLLLKIRGKDILGGIGKRNTGGGDQTRRILVPNKEPIRITTATENLETGIEITRNRHLRLRSWHEFGRLGIEFEAGVASFLGVFF